MDKVLSVELNGNDALRASNESVGLSTPYNLVPLFAEVCYRDPDYPEYHGFCIEARNNITNRERRELQSQHTAIREFSDWWIKSKPGDTDSRWGEWNVEDTPKLREFILFSRYIRAWNARGYDEEGNIVTLPSPSEAPNQALEYLEPPLIEWLVSLINVALAQGKGLRARARELEGSPEVS